MNGLARAIAECVSSDRIARRLADLAQFGDTGNGGVNRQIFSQADRNARRYLVEWARSLGLEVFTDPIGNQFFRLTPSGATASSPAWTAGSHLDSQPTGGRFDGVFGVVAAFEAIQALIEAEAPLTDAIEAVAWSNEEGSRFAPGCMGSMCYVGRMRLDDFRWVKDASGSTLSDELFATLASTDRGLPRAFETAIKGYLEVHIEQGPVLHREGLPVAVVDGIQGCRWYAIDVTGMARHAGTTPMHVRADAVREAAAMIVEIHRVLDDPEGKLKVTVGRLQVSPGAPNTIADHVHFTVDIRHPDDAALERAEAALSEALSAKSKRCQSSISRIAAHPPTAFDPRMQAALTESSAALDIRAIRMTSGAFHDAMYLAGFCPTAMLFVPSHGGISHHPDEFTDLVDLAAGTRVLAAALARLAGPQPGANS